MGRPHPLQAAIGKLSLALTSTLSPCKAQQRQALSLRRRGISAQACPHQNSREQMFASCSGLGFSSGDTGRILPACGVGAAGATRRCEARPQTPLMVAVGELHGAGRRTPGALVSTLAANATRGPALSPDPHPQGGEGGAGCSGNAPQLW